MSYGTGTPSNSQDVDGIVTLDFHISNYPFISLKFVEPSSVLNLQDLGHQAIWKLNFDYTISFLTQHSYGPIYAHWWNNNHHDIRSFYHQGWWRYRLSIYCKLCQLNVTPLAWRILRNIMPCSLLFNNATYAQRWNFLFNGMECLCSLTQLTFVDQWCIDIERLMG
jgi:hypothetical protein